jgi:hypothetical protein
VSPDQVWRDRSYTLWIDRKALIEVRSAPNPLSRGKQASLDKRVSSDDRGIAAAREREQP